MARKFTKAPGVHYLCLSDGRRDRTIQDGEILEGDEWANYLGEGLVEVTPPPEPPKAKPEPKRKVDAKKPKASKAAAKPPVKKEDEGGVTKTGDVLSAASMVASGVAKKAVVGAHLLDEEGKEADVPPAEEPPKPELVKVPKDEKGPPKGARKPKGSTTTKGSTTKSPATPKAKKGASKSKGNGKKK